MIGEKIFCGLDIGSQQIKASAVKVRRGNQNELLAVHSFPSHGLRKSTVNDLAEFTESVHQVLTELARKAGIKFKDVNLGLGGGFIETRVSKAVMPLIDRASKVVTNNDIKKINKQAQVLGIKLEEVVLHDHPQYYFIDDMNRVLNPAGLYGRKIGVTSLLIIAHMHMIGNITKAISQAGYEVSQVMFTSLISAEVALNKQMMENGCLLMDMGAQTTDLLFFKEGFLRHLDILPIGGNHLTGSIAQVLSLPFDLAEDVKKSHAAILSEELKGHTEILIKKDDGYISIKRKVVCEAIDSEIAKLISSMQNTIKFSHLQEKLHAGIVIVGGGSLLPGFIEHIEKNLNTSVQIGKVNLVGAAINNASVFSAAIGLAQDRFVTKVNPNLAAPRAKNFLGYLANKIQDLYEEYF